MQVPETAAGTAVADDGPAAVAADGQNADAADDDD